MRLKYDEVFIFTMFEYFVGAMKYLHLQCLNILWVVRGSARKEGIIYAHYQK